MPIGSAKIGVLGAGLVPGGTQTFNASGTFTVPPGVKKVNITGKGGTGNPGNAGNSGNPGNPGSGGGGGSGGASSRQAGVQPTGGSRGGIAWKPDATNFYLGAGCGPFNPWFNAGTAPPTYSPKIAIGGAGPVPSPCFPFGGPSNGAQTGVSGNAGTAGTAGNPGNTGQSSSGLCKTFPGGAGGNAGVAGAAGNGGGSGPAGGQGGNADNRNPGSAGTGAGAGGAGAVQNQTGTPLCRPRYYYGGGGGGGAGVASDAASGKQATVYEPGTPCTCRIFSAYGGTYACSTKNLVPGNCWAPTKLGNYKFPRPPTTVNNCTIGGSGGSGTPCNFAHGSVSITLTPNCYASYPGCIALPSISGRSSINQFSPAPLAPGVYRAGGGGGSGAYIESGSPGGKVCSGGGGGGGGRGGAGNAGGTSSTPSGSAATPSTFNCVPVTPGSPYPITVASPGGQIVISWNPQ